MTDTTDPSPPSESPGTEHKSTGNLLTEALNHATGLIRGEVNLLRAEASESLTQAATAVGMIAGAVVLVLVALNVLTAALVDAIASLGLDAGWAALIVGVVFAVIAAIMLRKGTKDLKATRLAPNRTSKNVQKDAYAVKESLHG